MVESRISGEFTGWDGDTLFKLDNGQYWKQASYAYRYHYAYRPTASIRQSGGRYFLNVECMDDEIEVVCPTVIESRIDGEFTGWSGDTEFRLINGQVWQQSQYSYRYKYAYSPRVLICDGKLMLEDDTSHSVRVRRLH